MAGSQCDGRGGEGKLRDWMGRGNQFKAGSQCDVRACIASLAHNVEVE